MALPSRYLVFTDLDGTLLDHKSYSFAAAQDALYELERRQAPLVLVTSKTRAEVEVLRRKLRNQHPFISENGGGVFIPQGYFPRKIPGETRIARYHVLMLARPYTEMVEQLQALAAEAGAQVVGFHDMSAREVARNTGLSTQEAELARRRDFDEPFFFAGGDATVEERFLELARQRGLEVARGGRFWHIFAGSDKGKATKKLLELYRAGAHQRLRSIGLGDSANDLPMLHAVDVPYLIPKPDGSYDEEVIARLPAIHRAPAPGPKGWNQVMLELLR